MAPSITPSNILRFGMQAQPTLDSYRQSTGAARVSLHLETGDLPPLSPVTVSGALGSAALAAFIDRAATLAGERVTEQVRERLRQQAATLAYEAYKRG
jgi:hypothetical protein